MRRSALGLIAVLVMGAALWAVPAVGQSAGQDQPPSAGSPRLELLSQSAFVRRVQDSFNLTVRVTGGDGRPLRVRLRRYRPLTSTADTSARDRLDDWLAGRVTDPQPIQSPVAPFELTDQLRLPEDPSAYALAVPLSPSPSNDPHTMQVTDNGVFPVDVTLLVGDELTEADHFTTFLVATPEAERRPPLRVATVVPFRAPVSLRSDGQHRFETDDNARLRRVEALLRNHPTFPLTLEPIAETVEGMVRVPPGSGTPTAGELASAVGERSLLSGTFSDLDVSAWTGSDLHDELERQRVIAADTLTRHLAPRQPLDRATWSARRSLSPDALAALASTGVGRLVVPDEDVAGLDDVIADAQARDNAELRPFDIAHPTGRMRTVTADHRLGSRFTATSNVALNTQIAIADVALLACGPYNRDCPALPDASRGIVLWAPDDALGAQALDRFLSTIAALNQFSRSPIVVPATLDDVFNLPPATPPRSRDALVRAYEPPPATTSMGAYTAAFSRAKLASDGYDSMMPLSEQGRADQLRQLLDVAGAANAREPATNYFDSVTARVDATVAGIDMPADEPITLTSSQALVQLRVGNRLDHPVLVRVLLSSDRLTFGIGKASSTEQVVTLEPGVGHTVTIDVDVRTPGVSALEVEVRSPDRMVTVGQVRLQVRSTVGAGLGLVVTIAAGIFLLVWWGRHFRHHRRSRQLVATEATEAAAAPPPPDPHEPGGPSDSDAAAPVGAARNPGQGEPVP